MIKQEQENHFQNKHSCFLVLGSLRGISIWAHWLFNSADNVLKLSPWESLCVGFCMCAYMCVCMNMCGNYPNSTRQNTIIEPTTNISRPPPPPPKSPAASLFSKFSFQRLMTEKIKINDVTLKWDGDRIYGEGRKKMLYRKLLCCFVATQGRKGKYFQAT